MCVPSSFTSCWMTWSKLSSGSSLATGMLAVPDRVSLWDDVCKSVWNIWKWWNLQLSSVRKKLYHAVPENIHTSPMEGHGNSKGEGVKKKSMDLNWNLWRGKEECKPKNPPWRVGASRYSNVALFGISLEFPLTLCGGGMDIFWNYKFQT